MQATSPHADSAKRRRHARVVLKTGFVALAVALLAGCGTGGGESSQSSSPLPTPTFGSLEIPDPSGSNNWTTFSTSNPPAEVLPTRGRAVRLFYNAPAGSIFSVSLRELATATLPSVTTTLTQNSGTPAAPGAGFFQILSENPSSSQAIYHMYVRAPASLTTNPANFDILVVNQSASSNATDSSPMVVMLRARKIYTVAVTVTGDGKVTSQPGGIQCGTSPLGHSLTDCSFDFGPGQVTLAAQDNDPNSITFSGWTGNCPAMSQTCVLTLDGTARMVANASFGAGSAPTGSTCSAAPPVSGWRWIGTPGCSDPGFHPGITLQCDAAGYFCCAPGNPGNPRCNGEQLIQADCRNQPNQGINARLIQPGGCYEVDTFP